LKFETEDQVASLLGAAESIMAVEEMRSFMVCHRHSFATFRFFITTDMSNSVVNLRILEKVGSMRFAKICHTSQTKQL
jgi:hypothetical protein